LNTSAPIAAKRPERALARRLALGGAALLLLALSGCAGRSHRPTPPEPVVVVPTRPTPPVRPTRPTPPPALTPMPPARNFGQEKARRKLELAADPRNAVGASEVGYYLDVLLGRLKQNLGPETGIARHGEHIVIVLPGSAAFEIGSAELSPGLRAKLAPLAKALLEFRRVLVSVHIRSDASVIGASNPRLAQARAQVVASTLGGAGLDPKRILIAPFGPAPPAAAQPGVGGRTRIEIDLEPVLLPNSRAAAPRT
jgi:outer membrane protein OmpA-like peptidoglycan-associated protein